MEVEEEMKVKENQRQTAVEEIPRTFISVFLTFWHLYSGIVLAFIPP
jgi:hypothetical protein